MPGALAVATPAGLLEKLEHEMKGVCAGPSDSYAAINALRDAYHLREWVWHGKLEHDSNAQTQITGSTCNESQWNAWVNQQFPEFSLIKDICNGSKHFEDASSIQKYSQSGLSGDHKLSHGFKLDDGGFYVETAASAHVSISSLLQRVEQFWSSLFSAHSQLR